MRLARKSYRVCAQLRRFSEHQPTSGQYGMSAFPVYTEGSFSKFHYLQKLQSRTPLVYIPETRPSISAVSSSLFADLVKLPSLPSKSNASSSSI